MSDEKFVQPGGFDLHIGEDKFNGMLRSDRRTRPANYPVLQEWFLGWTLSGHIPGNTTQHEPKHTFLLR